MGYQVLPTAEQGDCGINVMAFWDGRERNDASWQSIRVELADHIRESARDPSWYAVLEACGEEIARPRRSMVAAGADSLRPASGSHGYQFSTARIANTAGSQSDVCDAVRFFCNFADRSELCLVARIAQTLSADEQSAVVDAHASAREDQLAVAHAQAGISDRLVRRHTWPLALRRAQAKRFVDWCRARHIEPTRQRLPHGTVRMFMDEHVLLPGTSANQLRKHARVLVATLPGHEKQYPRQDGAGEETAARRRAPLQAICVAARVVRMVLDAACVDLFTAASVGASHPGTDASRCHYCDGLEKKS